MFFFFLLYSFSINAIGRTAHASRRTRSPRRASVGRRPGNKTRYFSAVFRVFALFFVFSFFFLRRVRRPVETFIAYASKKKKKNTERTGGRPTDRGKNNCFPHDNSTTALYTHTHIYIVRVCVLSLYATAFWCIHDLFPPQTPGLENTRHARAQQPDETTPEVGASDDGDDDKREGKIGIVCVCICQSRVQGDFLRRVYYSPPLSFPIDFRWLFAQRFLYGPRRETRRTRERKRKSYENNTRCFGVFRERPTSKP